MTAVDYDALLAEARAAREKAYVPYSRFKVGAALLTADGRIHQGCNVENAAYGPTNCAERTALFRTIADGYPPRGYVAMAVVGETPEPIAPCGTCRQVMAELCGSDMPVMLGSMAGARRLTTVGELLPGAFALEPDKEEGRI